MTRLITPDDAKDMVAITGNEVFEAMLTPLSAEEHVEIRAVGLVELPSFE